MPGQILKQIPKQRRSTEEAVSVEPRHYDETQVDATVTAELDEIDIVLEETAECLGGTAVSLAQEQERQEWMAWRAEYLAKIGIAA